MQAKGDWSMCASSIYGKLIAIHKSRQVFDHGHTS